jgi:uncharacterized protein
VSLITIVLYIFIGIVAGFLGGLLGIGGGLVVVPALLLIFYLFDFPTAYAMQVAVGTSLGAMVFTAASSAWAHYKQKGVYWRSFIYLAPGIVLGAILGAFIADYLPSKQLMFIFGFFITIIGIYFLFQNKIEENQEEKTLHFSVMSGIGILIGSISSVLGIGGGIITVPLLAAIGVPLRNAISTSAVAGFLIALIGAASFLLLGLNHTTFPESIGYLYIPAFFVIGLSATITAPFGAKLAYTLPTFVLRRVFGVVLCIVGVIMMSR